MSVPHDETDGDVSHDAWLREALRHAPDADALPPRKLSETILRQARAAATMPTTPPLPSFGQRVAAAWAWLGRPPVAAGFASVMVAGVVGLMWWDRPIEESLPPRDVAVPAAVQAPASQPTVAAAPAPAPAPAPPPAPAPAARTRDAATPAPPPAAEPVRPTAPAPRRAAAPTVAQSQAGAAAGPTPRPAESAALADAAPPAAPAPPAALAERDARTAVAAAERNERARSTAALSKAATPALRRDSAAPITALRSAIAAQPERWRWRREAGEQRAVEPAFERWLGQLETATASRWQADPLDATAGSRGETAGLQLWLDGRLHGTLRLDAGGVGYEADAAPAARQRAELPAAAAAALRSNLDEVTR